MNTSRATVTQKADHTRNCQKSPEVGLTDGNEKIELPNILHDSLRPLLICMSIFGLYFPPSGNEKSSRKCSALRIYCAAMIGLLISGIVRYTYVNHGDKAEFERKWAYHCLAYLFEVSNIVTACVMYASCCRKDCLESVFRKWQSLDQSAVFSTTGTCHFRKRTITLYVISLVCFLTPQISSFVLIFSKSDNVDLNSAWGIFSLIWGITISLCHNVTWILPSTLICILSTGLTFEFSAFNKDFKAAIKTEGKFAGVFERYRKRHQSICNLVDAVDDNVSLIWGSLLVVNIAQTLLKFFLTLRHPDYLSDATDHSIMVIWFTLSLGLVMLICVCGALVNQKAHSCLPDIHDCDLINNKDISVEIQVFLARLSGDKIGLTVMKMFVIDKNFILTVFGVLVTYYIVLEQFQSAAPSCNAPSVNATSAM